MKKWLLAALLLALLGPSLAAQDDVRPQSLCRLAYAYRPQDGMLTCSRWTQFWTFYAHPWARRSRQLPAGLLLTVEYVEGEGCAAGCWTRILRIDR